MPYRVRTGGNDLRFMGATDQDIVSTEQLYGRLGVIGLVSIVLGTGAQVIATVWPVIGSLPSMDSVWKVTIEVICAAIVIYILFRENSKVVARNIEARIKARTKELFDFGPTEYVRKSKKALGVKMNRHSQGPPGGEWPGPWPFLGRRGHPVRCPTESQTALPFRLSPVTR